MLSTIMRRTQRYSTVSKQNEQNYTHVQNCIKIYCIVRPWGYKYANSTALLMQIMPNKCIVLAIHRTRVQKRNGKVSKEEYKNVDE